MNNIELEKKLLYVDHPGDYYARQMGNHLFKGAWFRKRQHTTRELVRRYSRNGLIVDIGCGNCLWHQDNLLVIGIDLNRKILRYNKEHLPGFYPIESDINQGLPLRSSSVGTVIITELVEHFDEHAFLLSEIYRALKPGGIIICSVPYSKPPGIWEIIFTLMCQIKGNILGSEFYKRKCGHKSRFNKHKLIKLFKNFSKLECFSIYMLTIFYVGEKPNE